MGKVGHVLEEILGVKVVEHPPPVKKKSAGRFLVVHHVAEYCRQPLAKLVAGAQGELLLHLVGPCLRHAFPAVHKHAAGIFAFQGTVEEMTHIVTELHVGSARIQFVAFPARSLLGCGSVLACCVDVADAKDGPLLTLRSLPHQVSLGVEFRRDVYHRFLLHEGVFGLFR